MRLLLGLIALFFFAGPGTAQAPSPKKNLPSLFMLAVGINQYVKGWEKQCRVNDATELTKTIVQGNKLPKIFGKVERKLVTDKAATRQGILDGLAWLKANAKAHDVVILFYAGRGENDDDGDFLLLSSDWAPEKRQGTTVSGKELRERLADLPCRVLLMLEGCKLGAAAKAKQRVPPPRSDKLSSELTGEVGTVVLFAAGSNELAGEDAKRGHGYFTLAVLEALRGQADRSKDGLIRLNELLTYVEYRVPQLTNDNQHPTADKPGNLRSFALAVRALEPASN